MSKFLAGGTPFFSTNDNFQLSAHFVFAGVFFCGNLEACI